MSVAAPVQENPQVEASAETIERIRNAQKTYFNTHATESYQFRAQQLKKLREAVKRNERAILDALKADLGKHEVESYGSEIGFILEEIQYTLKNLKSWMRPESSPGPLTQFLSWGKVYSQPYGNVLIIAPWNYPFQLTISPLIGAMAAGNTTVLKPSEHAPATSEIVARLIRDTFDENYIAVIEGGVETNKALLAEPWDYLFFTGSPGVGKIVMKAAAEHLTPVTLELGGKSPAFIDRNLHLNYTARRLMWGKFYNAGQTCIAPDYLLVDRQAKDKLLPALKKTIHQFYGQDPQKSPDYPRIINDRHFERLTAYLEDGNVYTGGQHDAASRYIAPTILTDVDPNSPVMQEEIFGPILPVLTYDSLDEAINFVNARSKPLALYVFSNSDRYEERVLGQTTSGGACVNDTLVHLTSPHLPFGGVGTSGMGAYHGKASFDTFTHKRSVLKRSNKLDPPIRYAPYKNKLGLLKKLMPSPL